MKRFTTLLMCVTMLLMLTSCAFSSNETDPTTVAKNVQTTTDPAVTGGAIETTVIYETVQTAPTAPVSDDVFVRVTDYIPDVIVDLKYATSDNFTGQQIYQFSDVWLRYGTVEKLMAVQQELRQQDLCLKIWDGFRPPTAQFRLWEICPDPRYVSDPNNGFSSHSRGNTVDITLVDAIGMELIMPTGFDDFSVLADRDYSDCSVEAASNAQLLEQMMEKHGFKGYYGEWWHYSDTDQYEVEHDFTPE